MERWPPKLNGPQRYGPGRIVGCEAMTGDQSRKLKVGDRIRWGDNVTDLGKVVATSWSEVTIAWDDGEANSVSHNDMRQVEWVPNRLA
jgi:hypothetical protein